MLYERSWIEVPIKTRIVNLFSNELRIIFLFFLLVLPGFYGAVFSQVSASFSVDIEEGCSPLSVQFSNLSSPLANSTFEWDFGNGNFSSAVHPVANYSEVGQYSVRLIIENNGERDTLTLNDMITVHPQPVVSFSVVGDTIGCVPFQIEFENHTTNEFDLEYTWSFGDGNLSFEKHPTHTYLPSGVYDVTLLASNQYGCSHSFTLERGVEAVQLKAAFGIDKVQSCSGELQVHLNNLSSARPEFSSLWEFGDGNQSTEASPDHLFEAPGSYSVKLTITDDIGCQDSVIRNNLVQIVKTEALFTVESEQICINQNIRFTNKSNHSTNYLWRFGDGTSSTSVSPQKSYSLPGDYEVWLIADNGQCIDSTMMTIYVEEVIADFSLSDDFICQLPTVLTYYNQSINADSYEWRFGNGLLSTEENPSVEYTSAMMGNNHIRNFSDTLIVTSASGCKSTMIKENGVLVHLPNVQMSPGRGGNSGALNGCAPMQLTFQDRTHYINRRDDIIDWMWEVGDLPEQFGESIDVMIENGDRTPVTLTVITHNGCVRSATEYINAGVEVDVSFSRIGEYQRCASEMIHFEITSPPSSMRTREIWDFGDDSEITFPIPAHQYTDVGEMDVSLTIFNNGCPSTLTLPNHLRILGPYAEFSVQTDCDLPYEFRFSSIVKEATNFYWDFGDGSPFVSNVPTPVHTYSQSGNYVVRLIAENSSTGCDYVVTREVYARDIKSNFSIVDGLPCKEEEITFDSSQSADTSPFLFNNQTVRYLWSIEEEQFSYGTMNHEFVHSFENKGLNNVSLVVRDANGCTDTMRYEIYIYEPEPDFEASHETGCMPVTFGFTDKTESESPLVSWLWSFGDGVTSSEQNPLHDYNEFGSYSVTLEVTDEIGCVNILEKNQAVQAVFPDAGFNGDNTQICVGDTIRLFDISESDIVSFHWELSDGRISNEAEPLFEFNESGYYSVELDIVDVHGCEASFFAEDFIHVQKPPVAAYEADILTSNCYPLIVQFTDLSETEYSGTWEWQFAEGGSRSFLQNPYYIYNRPGKYDVRLIARTTYGCADTITIPDYIDVGGPYAEISVSDTVCLRTNVTFSAVEQFDVYDIRWDFGDGYSLSGESVVHQYQRAGDIYPIMIIRSDAANTCNIAIRDTLHVLDVRAIFSVQDGIQSGCVPWQMTLNNQSYNSTWWEWDFGNDSVSFERDPITNYSQSGIYQIQLIAWHELGCSDTTVLNNVEVFPLPEVKVSPDVIICEGDATTLTASGGVAYQWTPQEHLSSANSAVTQANPPVTTWYQVDVIDENGCENFAATEVVVQHPPHIELQDTTLIIGETFRLNVYNDEILSYEWVPAINLTCSDCPDPLFKALESVSYNVAVTDTSECFTVLFPFNLTVQKLFSVDLPKAFIPAAGGGNAVVYVRGWGIKELISLRIFNRFGQMVFESSDLEQGWDGEFKGQPLPSETYSYAVQVLTYDDAVLSRNGTIKLIR